MSLCGRIADDGRVAFTTATRGESVTGGCRRGRVEETTRYRPPRCRGSEALSDGECFLHLSASTTAEPWVPVFATRRSGSQFRATEEH